MGRKRVFGILGLFVLGMVAVVGEIMISGRGQTLADMSSSSRLSDISAELIGSDEATAQSADEARASEPLTENLDSESQQLLGIQRAPEPTIDVHEEESDEAAHENARLSAPPPTAADDAQLEDLRSQKQNLETQQEALIQEVLKLKKQVKELEARANELPPPPPPTVTLEGDADEQVAVLAEQLNSWRAKAQKERSNLKLLADHIMKLREELKTAKAELDTKTQELNSKSSALSKQGEELGALRTEEGAARKLGEDNKILNTEIERLRSQRDSLAKQVDVEKSNGLELTQSIESLRTRLQELDTERSKLSSAVETSTKELSARDEELESTKRQLSKTIEEARSCGISLDEKAQATTRIPELEKQVGDLRSSGEGKDREIASLKAQLADKEQVVSGIPQLKRELLAAKNQLLMKEKEQRILGGKAPAVSDPHLDAARDQILEKQGMIAGEESLGKRSPAATSDVMIVEVIANRVALKSGPSPDDSELMSVARGSKLVVEERLNDWYRVVAPNSTRAFIRADMVKVVSDAAATSSEVPVRRPTAPKKRPLKAAPAEPAMEPFGDVAPSRGDKIDKAFENLKKGLTNSEKPSAPELIQ